VKWLAKQLKSVELHQVAAEPGRSLSPAAAPRERWTVLANVKIAEDSAIALAKKAVAEGMIQKQFI
jgi:hypothetical protein